MWGNRQPYVNTIHRRGVPEGPVGGWVPQPAQGEQSAHSREFEGEEEPSILNDEDEVIVLQEAGVNDVGDVAAAFTASDDGVGSEVTHATTAETRHEDAANADDPPPQRFCRICYDDEDGGEAGFLFRPCLCAGTCGYVHVNCLNTWRSTSANRNSAFQCDQCKYEYRFGVAETTKLNIAQVAGARWFTEVASVFVLLMLIVVVGIVFDIFALHHVVGVLDEFGTAITDTGIVVRVLTTGGSVVGLVGFLVSCATSGVYHLFGPAFDGRSRDMFKIVLIIIGLVMAWWQIYKILRSRVRATIQTGTTVILDVSGNVPGSDRPAATSEAAED